MLFPCCSSSFLRYERKTYKFITIISVTHPFLQRLSILHCLPILWQIIITIIIIIISIMIFIIIVIIIIIIIIIIISIRYILLYADYNSIVLIIIYNDILTNNTDLYQNKIISNIIRHLTNASLPETFMHIIILIHILYIAVIYYSSEEIIKIKLKGCF